MSKLYITYQCDSMNEANAYLDVDAVVFRQGFIIVYRNNKEAISIQLDKISTMMIVPQG